MNRKWIVALVLVTTCGGGESSTFEVSGGALAGPTCPVETDPPDPACAPRPVVGAVIDAFDSSGSVHASTVTDDGGEFSFALPAGEYTLVPQAVEGLMGVASPVEIVVVDGPVDIGVLEYDTGIR